MNTKIGGFFCYNPKTNAIFLLMGNALSMHIAEYP